MAVTATISDDTDASATRCDNEIRSDSTCDLILRVFNTTSGERTWTLDKILVDKAFDDSTITPQTGTPGATKTLGQCPCQYPIAANANQTYKIHIEVGALRDGYTSGKINVYPSAYNGGQFPPSTVASYQLDIEIATSITINTVTDTTIGLSWVGNVFATRAFIFWWPEGGTFDSVTPMTTKDSTYTITGLTPATKYHVRVQPYKSLTKYQAKQVEVTTKASTVAPARGKNETVVSIDHITDTTITLSWTSHENATQTTITRWIVGDIWSYNYATRKWSYTITRLEPSTTYHLWVSPYHPPTRTVYQNVVVKVTTKATPPR